MLNTHLLNMLKYYTPTIEQLTHSCASVFPYNDSSVVVELSNGMGEYSFFHFYLVEDNTLQVETDADLQGHRAKVMENIVETLKERICSKEFSREDFFIRNGLPEKTDSDGWDKTSCFTFCAEAESRRVYFDMDGTLAVFNKNATMEEVFSPNYFRNLAPIPQMVAFAKELIDEGYDVHILSGACFTAIQEKIDWICEHMPFMPLDNVTFVPVDADKSLFIPDPENSILIDDYNKNLEEWKGLAVKCKTDINNFNPRFASVCIDFDNNREMLDKAIEEWLPKPSISLETYLDYSAGKEDTPYETEENVRPMIVCNDGFSVFIGAGSRYECSPKFDLQNSSGSGYTEIEVLYPSEEDKTLKQFTDEYLFLNNSMTDSVIPYVPKDLVKEMLEKHGGINFEKTFTPYDIERYELIEKLDEKGSLPDFIEKPLQRFVAMEETEKTVISIIKDFARLETEIGDNMPDFFADQINNGIEQIQQGMDERNIELYISGRKELDMLIDFAYNSGLGEGIRYLASEAEKRLQETDAKMQNLIKDKSEEEREEK